jgi:hypothetical protein
MLVGLHRDVENCGKIGGEITVDVVGFLHRSDLLGLSVGARSHLHQTRVYRRLSISAILFTDSHCGHCQIMATPFVKRAKPYNTIYEHKVKYQLPL